MIYSEVANLAVKDYLRKQPTDWVAFIKRIQDLDEAHLPAVVYWIVKQRLELLNKELRVSDHHATSIIRDSPREWHRVVANAVNDHLREHLPYLIAGDRILDYEILQVIGSGGMGTVYKARNLVVGNRISALKIIRPLSAGPASGAITWPTRESTNTEKTDNTNESASAERSDMQGSLQKEATSQHEADNEGHFTPQVYAAGCTEHFAWIDMEFFEGETLRDKIEKERTDENSTCSILDTIGLVVDFAKTLHQYVHSRNIVHKDIKPSNIQMSAGQLTLLDFGMAGPVETPATGVDPCCVFVGTPEFAAPEILKGQGSWRPEVDVYALASTLFFWMSGGKHARGEFPEDASARWEFAASSKPVSDRRVLADLSPRFEYDPECMLKLSKFITKCLSDDPQERGTMKQFAEDLDAIRRDCLRVEGESRQDVRRKPRRQTLTAILTLAVGFMGFSGAYLALMGGRDVGWPDRTHPTSFVFAVGPFGSLLCLIAAGETGRYGRRRFHMKFNTISGLKESYELYRLTSIRNARLVYALRNVSHFATPFALSWSSVSLARELTVWLPELSGIDGLVVAVVVAVISRDWVAQRDLATIPLTPIVVLLIMLTLWLLGLAGSEGDSILVVTMACATVVYMMWPPRMADCFDGPSWGFACLLCFIAGSLTWVDDDARRIHVSVIGESVVSRVDHNERSVTLAVGGHNYTLAGGGEVWIGRVADSVRGRRRSFASHVRRVSFEVDEAIVIQLTPASEIRLIDRDLGGRTRSIELGDETPLAFEFLPQLGFLGIGFKSGQTRIYDVWKPANGAGKLAVWKTLMPRDAEGVRVVLAPSTVPWVVCGHGARVVEKEEFVPNRALKKRVVSYKDTCIRIWDYSDNNRLFQDMAKATLVGHTSPIRCLAWSRDDQFLVSGSGAFDQDAAPEFNDSSVRVWDVAARKELHRLEGHVGPVLSVDISPDNRRVVSSGGHSLIGLPDKLIRVWNLESGKLELTLRGHSDDIIHVRFLDDRRILSVSRDRTIRIWEL